MNPNTRTFLTRFRGSVLLVTGALAAWHVSGAQSVLMAPPPSLIQPTSVQEDSTNNDMAVFLPAYDMTDSSLPQPLRFGPVTFRPHPYYHFLYDTGIKSGTNASQRSIVQEFSPGMTVDLGRHWTLDYTPTLRFYSNRAFRNSVDHSAILTGATRYEDWAFHLSQSFSQSDSTLLETATQTKQQNYDTEFGGTRILSEKLSLDFGGSQVFNYVSGFQNSRTWSTMEWLNYEYNKRLIFGVGAGGGYVNIESDSALPGNPDQSYEQMSARVHWRATDKLGFSLTGGFQEREILASGYDNQLNPTFEATIEYAPFDHTTISLNGSRSVSPSDYVANAQSQATTSVTLQLCQRILEDYSLTVGAGYTQNEYDQSQKVLLPSPPFPPGSTGVLGSIRTDDEYSFTMRLGRSFLKRGSVAVTYQYSDNISSLTGFSYRSNQIGFEIGFAY